MCATRAAGGSSVGAQVVLKVQKHLPFGHQLAVLSSDSNWSVDQAVKLEWAEGDVWSCTLAPASKTVDYKFAILNGGSEVLEWQPCNNRSLSIPDGTAIEVLDSWEGGELQGEPQNAQGPDAAGAAQPSEAPRKRHGQGRQGTFTAPASGVWGKEELLGLTVPELRAMGKTRGLRGLASLRKKDIIDRMLGVRADMEVKIGDTTK
ncbi:hypothetical protein WJX81_000320 [Elliptochloris bilobata]|uniref:CBM20 domain-containing protein n=1 Tax=Elliptochloris bilobata TaxID=381761 RepID=A0AAW1SJ13_9CHLO